MRLVFCLVGLSVAASGCAGRRCTESYGAMTDAQVVRRDGEILTALVERRQQAAQALQQTGEQSSRSGDIQRSIQAWEMAMSVIVQLQSLSRREEHASALAENRELTTKIRCLASIWSTREGYLVGAGEGTRMLGFQRELEAVFGNQGRPTDSQLSAIAEGRDIYMGPLEEEIDVPQPEAGTGPSETSPPEQEDTAEEASDTSSAVDDLLGE